MTRGDGLLAAALTLGTVNMLGGVVALHNVASERDAYRVAYEQWKAFGERENKAAHQWASIADGYAKQAREAEEAHLAIVQEREWLVWRVTHAEARTPFSLDFLRWADSGVTQCESSNDPRKANGRQWGLMQIDIPSHEARIARHGYTPADLLRPIPNLIVAESIWREQGAAPWPTCGQRIQ